MAGQKTTGEQERQAVRERLLQSALDIFNERGYSSSSVREIVEAAGVTKPALYYYFGSKEGIYMEFFKKPFGILETVLEEALHETLSARERVTRLFDRIFSLFVENLKAARLMYSIYYGPPQGAPHFDFDGYHVKMREVTLSIIKEGIRRGEIRAVNADVLTCVLLGALNFVMEEQLCHRSPQIDRRGLSGMLALIFDGQARTTTTKKR
jgi:TetR/AcrR family transcriptional regulator